MQRFFLTAAAAPQQRANTMVFIGYPSPFLVRFTSQFNSFSRRAPSKTETQTKLASAAEIAP